MAMCMWLVKGQRSTLMVTGHVNYHGSWSCSARGWHAAWVRLCLSRLAVGCCFGYAAQRAVGGHGTGLCRECVGTETDNKCRPGLAGWCSMGAGDSLFGQLGMRMTSAEFRYCWSSRRWPLPQRLRRMLLGARAVQSGMCVTQMDDKGRVVTGCDCWQARVEAAGGQILFWNGVRVMGVLAVSRAIGDHCLRPFVIAEPEVRAWLRCSGVGLGRAAYQPSLCAASQLAVNAMRHARCSVCCRMVPQPFAFECTA